MQYTLEYSTKQKCFHISTLTDVCTMNLSAISSGCPTDYLLIGVFDTYEEAEKRAAELRRNNRKYAINQPV